VQRYDARLNEIVNLPHNAEQREAHIGAVVDSILIRQGSSG
jgi:hypothetical protein